MTIISSQHHIDWEIVENKMEEIKGFEKVVIPALMLVILMELNTQCRMISTIH